MSDNDHKLVINAEGLSATHPELDRNDCDFDAYVAGDWQREKPGTYLFTWHPGGEAQPEGYWSGTKL